MFFTYETYFSYPVLVLFAFLHIVSCNSHNSLDEPEIPSDVSLTYKNASKYCSLINTEAINQIGSSVKRGHTREDYIGYLLSLPSEKIDSLYDTLNVEDHEELSESQMSEKLDSLLQVVPSEDIQNLFDFICGYIEYGGHSIEFIEDNIIIITTPELQNWAISSAALYDNLTSVETANFLSCASRASRACVLQLALDCGGISLTTMSAGVAYASGNVEFCIIDCIHDVVDVIGAIRRYHRCERFEAWR